MPATEAESGASQPDEGRADALVRRNPLSAIIGHGVQFASEAAEEQVELALVQRLLPGTVGRGDSGLRKIGQIAGACLPDGDRFV
jgi:hypothetical protein